MSFLYGDSTPSTLRVNFIEFLREAVDFCVRVLLADQRIMQERERLTVLQREADATIGRLDRLGDYVASSVEKVAAQEADPSVVRCGAAIARSAADLVRVEITGMQSALASEISKLETQAAHERAATVKALEGLLLKNDLPETDLRTHLRILGGTRYSARMLGTTPFGLELVLELDVPAGHLFSHVVRVEKVMERLEVLAPEPGGRGHRDAKVRLQRLDKHYVAEFAIGVTTGAIKLREAPEGTGGGFDLLIGGEEQRVRLVRVGQQDEAPLGLSEMGEADASKLRVLYERLSAPAAELNQHRRTLVDAVLDGKPLRDYERPAVLADRLIQHIAPMVQEIAARSLSPDELVLRRLISDDRREEIFVSKSELWRKLEPLPASLRGLFAPLGFGGAGREPQSAFEPRAQSQPPGTRLGPGVAVGTIDKGPGSGSR